MLQKQSVHLNMTGGVDKKPDQFLVIPSKLTKAENVEFVDADTVIQRACQALVSRTAIDGVDVSNVWRMFEHGGLAGIETDTCNGMVTPSGIRRVPSSLKGSYSAGRVDPQQVPRHVASVRRVARANRKSVNTTVCKTQHDSASNGTFRMTAWEEQSSDGSHTIAWRLESLDNSAVVATGALPGPDPTFLAVALSPRVLPSSTGFWLCYASFNYFAGPPSSFSVTALPVQNDGSTGAAVTIFSSAATGAIETSATNAVLFDAYAERSTGVWRYGFVVKDTIAAATITLTARDAAMTNIFTQTLIPSAAPRSLTGYISNVGGTLRVHAFFGTGGSTVRSCYATSAAASLESSVGNPGALKVVGRVAVGAGSALGADIVIGYDAYQSTNSTNYVTFSRFSATHGAVQECELGTPGWLVAGHIFTDSNRAYMALNNHTANLVSTLFVAELSNLDGNWGSGSPGLANAPHVVARISPGECPLPESPVSFPSRRVPGVAARAATNTSISFLRMGRDLVTVNNQNETGWDVSLLTLGARYLGQLGFEEVNGLTYLAGGCPLVFDGQQFVEEGFHHEPVIINSGSAAASGAYGPFSAGPCSFVFTEAWTDAQGNFHESRPSVAINVTFTAPAPYLAINVLRPPTRKPGSRLRVYRTRPTAPTDTALYLTVTETGTVVTSDTTLLTSEQLYTSGGVLPNTPAPACRSFSTFDGRLVASGCEDGSRVFWSKTVVPGYCAEFNIDDPTHQTQVPAELGACGAAESMDGQLYLLCESGVGGVFGTGPSVTGTQGEYSKVAVLSGEVGMVLDSPLSLAKTTDGLWFHSKQGIRLLTRAGSVSRFESGGFVGAEVDALVPSSLSTGITAVVDTPKGQVRFYASSVVLVFDTQWRQWSSWVGERGGFTHAARGLGRVYHAANDVDDFAMVRYFDNATMQDAVDTSGTVSTVEASVRTPHLSLAGIQGFQRVSRLAVLAQCVPAGAFAASFNMAGSITYNFTADVEDTFSFSKAPEASGRLQFQHQLSKQKCESLQLELRWSTANTGSLGRLRVTDITLQVGLKSGTFKQATTSRF